ncbi:hypothetical protein HDU76_004381, partial [Blyttiomyces sp. JEL0837]
DLYAMRERDQTKVISNVLEPYWAKVRIYLQNPSPATKPSLLSVLFKHYAGIWLTGGLFFALSTGAKLTIPLMFQQIIYYLTPFYPRSLLWIQSGLGIAFLIFALQLSSTLFGRSNEQIARTVTINIKTAMIGAVYEKALRLSGSAMQEFDQGRILNLINVDSETISEFMLESHAVWVTPTEVIVTIILLHNLLGNAVFAALGTMLASLLVQMICFAFIAGIQKNLLKAGDRRLKSIRELLYAIKIIKLHAWESIFETKISQLRNAQVAALKAFNIVIIIFVSLAQLTPIAMPVVAFIVYAKERGEDGLDPAIIFPALSLFQLLLDPLFVLPSIASALVRASVSWGRLTSFFLATEASPLEIQAEATKLAEAEIDAKVNQDAVSIVDATFKWEAVKKEEKEVKKGKKGDKDKEGEEKDETKKGKGKKGMWGKGNKKDKKSEETIVVGDDEVTTTTETSSDKKDDEKKEPIVIEPLIKNLTLGIPRGKLTCVVGSVGSGKSSLLSSIIGEMTKVSGSVSVRGKIAYAPQQPWILTDTVEGNVAFGGGEVYPDLMKKALYVVNFEGDLEMLEKGSLTLIGEKGVNLSGGQKARVALARAVYEDADIYLLDDPISALDAHVGATVFQRCIIEALSTKTRILVTHQLHFLPSADLVVVMDKGSIVQQGTFQDLMKDEDGMLVKLMGEYRMHEKKEGEEEAEENDDKEKNGDGEGDDDEKDGDVKKGGGKGIVEEEDRSTGALQGRVWLSFFKAAGGFAVAIPVLVATIVQQGMNVMTSQFLSWWAEDRFGWDDKYRYLTIYGVFGLAQALGMLSLNGLVLLGGYLASCHYHAAALKRLLKSPMSFFDSQPIGRILNRFSKDIEAIDQQLWVFFFFVIFSATGLLASLALVLAYFPAVFALIGPLLIGYYFLLLFYRATVRELKRLDSNQRSPLYAHISETLAGIPSVRAYKAEDKFITRQRMLLDLSNSPRYLYLCTSIWVTIRIEILASLLILTVCILGVTSAVKPTYIGLTLSYALSVVGQVGFLLKSLATLESEMNAVDRLDFYSTGIPIEAPAEVDSDPSTDVWPSKGAISIKNLEVRYPSRPDHPVIKDLTLDIKPGEKVGIVGRTGSGKSTLLTVLFRLVEPTSGSILIDDVDISTLGLKTLRSRLQIITQEPVLFAGTVRSNFDIEGRFSDNEIWDVLEIIGQKEYVSNLPEKLDAAIAANGENLSVGQRQLFCLGRAILYRSHILFLDEATASVDQAADALIQASIRTHFAEATVVSIAHRLNTVAGLDRVLVLDDGKMIEFDAPLTLLKKEGGLFKSLAEATGPANFNLLMEIAEEKERSDREKGAVVVAN